MRLAIRERGSELELASMAESGMAADRETEPDSPAGRLLGAAVGCVY